MAAARNASITIPTEVGLAEWLSGATLCQTAMVLSGSRMSESVKSVLTAWKSAHFPQPSGLPLKLQPVLRGRSVIGSLAQACRNGYAYRPLNPLPHDVPVLARVSRREQDLDVGP